MEVLVTGGAGFIGGHIAEQLADAGHAVTVLDNFVPYYDLGIKEQNVEAGIEAAEGGPGSYEVVEASITDREVLHELVGEVDVVYHQAAQAGVRKSVDQPALVNEYNVTGTINVLEAARTHGCERVVLASSSSVYGKPDYLPYDEEHPNYPQSPYGVTKLAAEHYCTVWDNLYDVATVSLRYFTVYGPRMRPNMAFTNFVSRCLHGESPIIYGDGQQTRDFTYIEDIAAANERLLETSAADGEVVNVGSGDRITVEKLASVIRDEIDPSLEIVYDDPREGDAEHTHADVSKAREYLGYEPTEDITSGVERFIDWYRGNREWYESLVRSS